MSISIFEAQGLKKASQGQWQTMKDLVALYCEHDYLLWRKDDEGSKSLETKVNIGLYKKSDIKPFWESIKILIVEKLSRECIAKHAKLIDSQVKGWVEGDLPEMEPGNLEVTTLSRIPNIYHLLETKSSMENHLEELVYQPNSGFEAKELREKLMKCTNDISDLLWNPKYWINSEQLVSDYKLFAGSVLFLYLIAFLS